MRRKIIEAATIAMLASCVSIDMSGPKETLGTGPSRNEVLLANGGRKEHGGHTEGSGSGFRKDTALYVSAIEFPKGYDWRKDTAYLRSGASIVLFRNGERVMTLPAGAYECIGSGADMHHIVQGHVVTEYYGNDGTTVKIDGKEVFHSSWFEVLRGLLMDGDKLLSLTQKKSGFVYRRGGSVVMERSSGEIIGSLGDDHLFQGGALSSDNGCICFAYRSADGTVLVEDGLEKPVACNGEVIDIRRIDTETCLLEKEGDHLRFSVGDRSRTVGDSYHTIRSGCHISILGDEPVAICLFDNRFGTSSTEIHRVDKAVKLLMGIHTIVPCEDAYGYITFGASSGLSITGFDGDVTKLDGPYLWMGTRACGSLGGDMILAATPYSTGGVPVMIRNGKKEEINLNGFVTGVSCVINHPS